MTARKTKSTPCKVGYGNPPRHTRFRKGRSGNPRGRPPRDPAQRLKALTLQEAYRATVVREDGRMVPVTSMQAILRSQVELAAKGNVQAQRAIFAAVRRFEQENERDAETLECMAMLSPVVSMFVARALGREREADAGSGDPEKQDAEEPPRGEGSA